jgi:hypothetical protein
MSVENFFLSLILIQKLCLMRIRIRSPVFHNTSLWLEFLEENINLQPVLRIRIRIRIRRIHMFLRFPDPDPLVSGMDPDPSVIMQK